MEIVAPTRARHSYVQRLAAPPERVFPLLCPVREVEWVNGWCPRRVISESGVAEAGCVFLTPEPGGRESVWVVTRHEPAARVSFLKVTPGVTVGEIDIRLSEAEGGTAAEVSYAYTALGPEGESAVAAFTADGYRAFMREWEAELNHFLRTGEKLAPARG